MKNLSTNREWIIGVLSLLVGSFFHFVPNNLLRAWGLTLGLGHNDHVIIGSILLIIAFVSAYSIILKTTSKNQR